MMAVRIPPRLFPPAASAFLLTVARAESSASAASLSVSVAAASSGGMSGAMSSPHPPSYTTLKDRATCEREIKKSKFIAIAAPISDERSAHSFLEEVRDPRATHNCWAYKLGDQYRSNDDGEPSGTAGKPIYSAIVSSGIDMVMVVVIRHFGGIKLGTGGLVRAYGGVALECLKGGTTYFVKPKAPVGIAVPFELLGSVYHQLQHFQAEDIKQDYDTGEDGFTMVTFKIDYDRIDNLEDAVNSACSRKLDFFKR